MSTWLLLNSLGLCTVGGILYLVVRQMGFILQRVGPTGARGTAEGPRIGENLMHHLLDLPPGASPAKSKLLLFGADACSICARVKAGALVLARTWRAKADILIVYDCHDAGDASDFEELSKGVYFKHDPHLRKSLGATFVPFGIVTDRHGTVVGKGLVNEIAHLESLLELEQVESRKVTGQRTDVSVQQGAQA